MGEGARPDEQAVPHVRELWRRAGDDETHLRQGLRGCFAHVRVLVLGGIGALTLRGSVERPIPSGSP